MAKILDIPFYVFNFEKEFKKKVVDYFLREYKSGRTPNPCVVCNKEIKFGLLLERALKMDADYVATGHYVRKSKAKSQKSKIVYKLLRGEDKQKDQSYFLWQLSQKQLRHILFPIGSYTKAQVRELAKEFKLPVFNTPESQEICFVPGELNDFLKQYLKTKPGRILNIKDKGIDMGEHQGLPFYTIGQRKGMELSGGPFYVVEKDFQKNNLIVANFFNNKALYKKGLIAKNVNWILGKKPEFPLKVKAQLRYGHKPVSATVVNGLKKNFVEVIFTKAQRAITPGQSVVFYCRNELLAGGIIKTTIDKIKEMG